MATHKPIVIDELFGELKLAEDIEKWHAIHTKPQCEKKLAEYLKRNEMFYYLPLMDSIRQYKYRKVTFTKPMFPGYLFARFNPNEKASVFISGYVVSFIKVPNEQELLEDLHQIYIGRANKAELKQTTWLENGWLVEIISGPMMGLRGIVQNQSKLNEVILKVELLKQAVSMSVNPLDVKIIKRV